jgi:hypothetical protein
MLRNVDSNDGAGHVAAKWNEWGAQACFIDDTGGFGAGWLDRLRDFGYKPVGIHFAGNATSKRYFRKRTEMWFSMAEWIKGGGALPNIPEIIPELTEPTYTFKDDRLFLEPKELFKKRLTTSSPDMADALALTFAFPVEGQRAVSDPYPFRKPSRMTRHDTHGIPSEWEQ